MKPDYYDDVVLSKPMSEVILAKPIATKHIYCPNPLKWSQTETADGFSRTQYPCGEVDTCKPCARWRGIAFKQKLFNRLNHAEIDGSDNINTIRIKLTDELEPFHRKYIKDKILRTSVKLNEPVHENKLLTYDTSAINVVVRGEVSDEFIAELQHKSKYEIESIETKPTHIDGISRIIGKAYKNYHFTGLLYGLSDNKPITEVDKKTADDFVKHYPALKLESFKHATFLINKLLTNMAKAQRDSGQITNELGGYLKDHIAKMLLTVDNPVLDYIAEQYDDGLIKRQMKNVIKYNYTDLKYVIAKSEAIERSSEDFVMEEVAKCTQCFLLLRVSLLRDDQCFACNRPFYVGYNDEGISMDDFDPEYYEEHPQMNVDELLMEMIIE